MQTRPPAPPAQIASSVVPVQTVRVARLTGATPPGEMLPNPNQTAARDGVYGTDLGILWDAGDHTVMVAFGDTYGSGWGGAGAGPADADWRSNTLALSEDLNPARGLLFSSLIHDRPGHAGELIPGRRDDEEHTIIPTSGISVGTRQYLSFMSVARWGVPGSWQTNYAGLACSDDAGRTWTRAASPVWKNTPSGDNPFQQAALVKSGEEVYLFGTPNGRHGKVSLARVAAAHILDGGAYEYWDGHGWQAGKEAAAVPVADGPAGELSVCYNSFFRRWLMLSFDVNQNALVLRDAALPGPWSAPTVLLRASEYPGLYGGYIDPLHNSGKDLYFTLSLWHPYKVFWMHTVLEKTTR